MTERRRAGLVVAMCLTILTLVGCTRAQADAWCRTHQVQCDHINGVTSTTAKPKTTSTTARPTTTTSTSTTTIPPTFGGGGGGGCADCQTAPTTQPPVAPTIPTTTTTVPPTTVPVGALHVAAMGDSQTVGTSLLDETLGWVLRLRGIEPEIVVNNVALGGTSIAAANITGRGPSMQEHLDDVLALDPDVIVLLGGTNDFTLHSTAPVVQAALEDIVTRTAAAGVRLIVSTVIPFGTQAPQWVATNPDRIAVNEWIRGYFPAENLIDFDAYLAVDDLLPDHHQEYGDGVHVSAAANLWFAQQVAAKLHG